MLIIANAKDQVIADWLRQIYSDAELAAAVAQLAGNRRPYVSNVCKVLGVSPPPDVTATATDALRRATLDVVGKI